MDVKQEYLRISLTDKCNYRCKYCLPNGNINSIENNKFLKIEEYFELAKIFNDLIGLKKIRLTGGEPLLRKGLNKLVQMLSTLDPKPEISITTNGHYLSEKINDLIISGIDNINISIDSLDSGKFKKTTGNGNLQKVLGSLKKAQKLGFSNVKINTVVTSTNFNEIPKFIDFAKKHEVSLRFIELMSFSSTSDYHKNEFISAKDIEKKLTELLPKENNTRESKLSPAVYRKINKSKKEIGLIAAASDPGCHKCTRLRISCDGKLFVCLYQNKGIDLKHELRNKNTGKLQEIIERAIKNKRTYNPLKTKEETWMSLSQIGG
tara:strand:+ start:12026 stop:12985 length:960 start_codon:yes stop_codon:yes gene_type:complete